MKFRHHRGGFADSMETEIEVHSHYDIINSLDKIIFKSAPKITFKHIGFDERNKWDTYYVIAKEKNNDACVIGMSDGII